jgi:hypothetical protein
LTEFTDSTSFKEVARIIAALSTQDERIAEEFRITTSGKKSGSGGRIEFTGTVPFGMKLDLTDFAVKISAKIWERVAIVNWRSFEEARAFVHKLGFKNRVEWEEYCKSFQKPYDIPSAPWSHYSRQEWKGMGDWLGTGTIATQFREYLPYLEARAFVHKLGLTNRDEWNEYSKSGQKPDDIPNKPDAVYLREGWKGIGDWLGTGVIAPRFREYLPFVEARVFVHKLGIKNRNEWNEYCKSGKKPDNLPNAPEQKYKHDGWISMGDWLGTGTIATQLREYRSFEEARAFVHKLGLKNRDEWNDYCKSGQKPDDIPNKPDAVYLREGWKGIGDWLGTGVIASRFREYLPFVEARSFVHTLKLKSQGDWLVYSKSGKRPNNIPSHPNQTYKGKGWSSWADWLG